MTAAAPGRPSGRPSRRLVWMLPAGLSLLAGLDAALLLIGVRAPVTTARLPEVHGMLLVLGFVATLISLERASALGRWYGFVAPALLGVGGVALIADPVPLTVAKALLAAGMAAFTLLYLPLWRRQYDPLVLTQLLAAALGMVGAIIWLGQPTMDRPLPWLIAFVVLTIAAERVELARITMGATAGQRMLVHAWAVSLALLLGIALPEIGAIALGLVICALAVWLIQHDIARRTVRTTGVTRYMAACILAGYVWLVVAGVALTFGSPTAQPVYDAVTHAIFLGYTMSMIMAHATTILPAVLGIKLPYRPAFWVPAAILQLSLLVRLWLGDALGIPVAWTVGGTLAVVALLLFLVTAVVTAVQANATPHSPTPAPTPTPRSAAPAPTPAADPSQGHR